MEKILKVEELKKYYPVKKGVFGRAAEFIKAVDGVSFSLLRGQTLGLVGESGCGKSTLARTILRLIDSDSGKIIFKGRDITALSHREIKSTRKDMQIIFQDPFNSLDPRFTVFGIVSEGLRNFSQKKSKKEIYQKVAKALEDVGLPRELLSRYPHEFSGGQRQRISIARALVLEPELLVLDEPVSSLDVSIQAQVINLLVDLQKKKNLSYIFIAHDLGIVRHICDQVCVMKDGKIVESGKTEAVFQSPGHPYTRTLLDSAPALPL